jgi:hypothetical protein
MTGRSLRFRERDSSTGRRTFERQRDCPLPFLHQSFREQREPVLRTRNGPLGEAPMKAGILVTGNRISVSGPGSEIIMAPSPILYYSSLRRTVGPLRQTRFRPVLR